MTFFRDCGREGKALKIEAVLKDYFGVKILQGKTILDIGCGGGGIASYFSDHNYVFGVDVEDRILPANRQRIRFTELRGNRFPFDGGKFDVIISNHVIEHLPDQEAHLSEIYRLLKPGGVCYLATPNKNFIREPHYRIPFIHYLPGRLFYFILRRLGKMKEELYLLSYSEMWKLFRSQHFETTEYTARVLHDPEGYHLGMSPTKFIPLPLLRLLEPGSPTSLFILRRPL